MKLINILKDFNMLKRMDINLKGDCIKYATFHPLRILERQDCHCYGFTSRRINLQEEDQVQDSAAIRCSMNPNE
jgi:hypothetical protein